MSTHDRIEVTASTVEQAIKQALEQLGAEEEDVSIEVLATPRAGVLGLGARDARVRVTARPSGAAVSGVQSPPSAPPVPELLPSEQPREAATAPQRDSSQDEESDEASPGNVDFEGQARQATEVLAQILELMGEKAKVVARDIDDESIELEIKGDGSGILIGRHGQTLDSLEYVVNRIVSRRIREAVPIVLETESYRARRRQQLHRMALQMGERAKREHEPVLLDPMPPRDRRVVHLALKDDPMVTTRSSGDGFLRSVEIIPTEGKRDRGGDGRGPRRRERPDAVGEQGGFKHGQKRIV